MKEVFLIMKGREGGPRDFNERFKESRLYGDVKKEKNIEKKIEW